MYLSAGFRLVAQGGMGFPAVIFRACRGERVMQHYDGKT